MKIEKNGRTYDIGYIIPRGDDLTVSVESDEKISVIASDFEGNDEIRATEENVIHVYEGYGKLMNVSKMTDGRVRLMLRRE
jgi:hypothetical protein